MMNQKRQIWYRLGVILAIVLVFGLLLGAVVWRAAVKAETYQAEQASLVIEAEELLVGLYDDYAGEVPSTKVTQGQIDKVKEKLEGVVTERQAEAKAKISQKLELVRKFVALRDELEGYFVEDTVKVETTDGDVQKIQEKMADLPSSYAEVLQARFAQMQEQIEAIQALKAAVQSLFTDEKMTVVKPKVTRAQYRAVAEQATKLPQKELAKSYDEALARVDKVLTQRLTDPWTQAGGGRTYDIPRAELEQIYNAVGKRAVVVR